MDISVQYSFNARKLISAKNVNVIQRGPEITSEKQMTIPHQVRIRNVTSSPFRSEESPNAPKGARNTFSIGFASGKKARFLLTERDVRLEYRTRPTNHNQSRKTCRPLISSSARDVLLRKRSPSHALFIAARNAAVFVSR